MYIIITGAGTFGSGAAEKFARESHDIVMVDTDPVKIDHISHSIDCKTVLGNATSHRALKEAGIQKADLLLAMTSDDHANIITGMIAREYNVATRIGKISEPEFHEPDHVLRFKDNGIFDLMISPEQSAADEIMRLFEMPDASDFNYFAKNLGAIVAYPIPAEHRFVGKKILDLKEYGFGTSLLIAAIDRGNDTLIPKGHVEICEEDILYIAGSREAIRDFAGQKKSVSRQNVIITGGGKLALKVARSLENWMQVKIIEENFDRCEALSAALTKTIVLHGSGSDAALLKSEHIEHCRAIITLSSDEENNILVGVLGKSLGAEKAFCLTQRQEYAKLLPRLGVDATISPKTAALASMTRMVRKGQVETVISFKANNVEAIEFVAPIGSRVTKDLIQNLELPEHVVIGGIVKNQHFYVPSGSTRIQAGDHVIVFSLPENISIVESYFAAES